MVVVLTTPDFVLFRAGMTACTLGAATVGRLA
jgi:hypothetical protein